MFAAGTFTQGKPLVGAGTGPGAFTSGDMLGQDIWCVMAPAAHKPPGMAQFGNTHTHINLAATTIKSEDVHGADPT